MIRDWNTPDQFCYGLSGGQAFLKRKLELKENQSESAQTVRQHLNECFEELSCFLMPDIGSAAKKAKYNGSVNGLADRFVEKMEELIVHLLDAEEINAKIIDNNQITGEMVLHYFKSYVDIFNSDELPKPIDLIEATAKTGDFIQLNKLKVSFQSLNFEIDAIYLSFQRKRI